MNLNYCLPVVAYMVSKSPSSLLLELIINIINGTFVSETDRATQFITSLPLRF